MMLKVPLTSRTIAPKLIQPRIGAARRFRSVVPDVLPVGALPAWVGRWRSCVVGALAIAGGEASTVRRAGGQAAARARSARPVGGEHPGQSAWAASAGPARNRDRDG